MMLSQLTVADLQKIQKWLKRKEALTAKIAAIDRQLNQIETGTSAAPGRAAGRKGRPAKAGRRRKRAGGGGRPGVLKEKIVAALKAAGKPGLHVKDLSRKLGVKKNNIRVWFYITGKHIPQIKKIKPATYRWAE